MRRRRRLGLWLAATVWAVPAIAGAQALPGGRFYVKNNTRATVACTLSVGAAPPLAVKLKAGKEFSAAYGPNAPLALSCPKVRATAFAPLKLGTHYAFLRVQGRVDLVEVSPDDP